MIVDECTEEDDPLIVAAEQVKTTAEATLAEAKQKLDALQKEQTAKADKEAAALKQRKVR